jgi:hypothetical protein
MYFDTIVPNDKPLKFSIAAVVCEMLLALS